VGVYSLFDKASPRTLVSYFNVGKVVAVKGQLKLDPFIMNF